jgi:hypothetical protein
MTKYRPFFENTEEKLVVKLHEPKKFNIDIFRLKGLFQNYLTGEHREIQIFLQRVQRSLCR